MKKIILALLVVLPFLSRAQSAGNDTTLYIYYKYTYGNALDRYWARKVLVLPNDTIYSKDGLAIKAGVLYVGNGVKWSLVTGGGGGGGFTLADTGYTRTLVSPFLLQKTIDSMKIVNAGLYKLKADSAANSSGGYVTQASRQKLSDSLQAVSAAALALKKNISDSLANQTFGYVTQASRQKLSDSLQAIDAAARALKKNIADSAANQSFGYVTQASRQKLADSLLLVLLHRWDTAAGNPGSYVTWASRKKLIDSITGIFDTTKIRYYGTGDTLLRAGGLQLLSSLVRDSGNVHITINPDSSLTFYGSGGAGTDSGFNVLRSNLAVQLVPILKGTAGALRNILWDTAAGNPAAIVTQASRKKLADSLATLIVGGVVGAYYPPLDSVLWKGPISARNMQVAGIKSTGQDTLTATTYSEAYDRVVIQDTATAAGNGKLYRRKMQTVDMTGAKTGLWPIYQSSTGTFTFANDTTMNLGNWTYHSGIQPGGKTLNFLGDSWTFGSGASSPTTTSFPAIVSGATGATMGQYGVAGMTLETDGTGNNYQGVPSIIQRLSTIPNNSTSTVGIILEFGLNDLPPVGSYNPTHLASALDTLLRHVIDTAHFTRREVAVMGMPWIPDATLAYYGTISGGTAPTRARLKQYDSVIQAACIKWGVLYIPCYYQLKDNMNDSSHYVTTGQLHLDDAGHKFYGYNIIQKLSLQTGSPWSQSGSTIQAVTTPANVNLSTSGTGVSTSTPNYIDWGDRYGIVEGPAQLKAIFYNDGTVNNRFGVGVYSGKMLIHAGGASTVMDFWIGGNPYLSLSTSAFTLNGATQNKFQLRNTTSSGTATPDQVNAGGTFLNSGVFDSSKTKLAWYQSSSSAFGGVGINNTNSYFVTPHGFPFAFMYDNTSSLIVDKYLTASNYASQGNKVLITGTSDTSTYAPLFVRRSDGKVFTSDWAGLQTIFGGASGATYTSSTSSVSNATSLSINQASYTVSGTIVHVVIDGSYTATSGGNYVTFSASLPSGKSSGSSANRMAGFGFNREEPSGAARTLGQVAVANSASTASVTLVAGPTNGATNSFVISFDYSL